MDDFSALRENLQRKNQNILLLVDNCPAQCKVKLKNIRLEFLPPNLTASLQPMDQGVIKCLKDYFRRFLVLKMIENAERKVTTEISLLDAIIMLKKACDTVTSDTIANCFSHAGWANHRPTTFVSPVDELASEISQFGLEMPVTFFD